MSAKRYRNRAEHVALLEYREALRLIRGTEADGAHGVLALPDTEISAVTPPQEGRVLIPRPDTGRACNDALPVVCSSSPT